MAFPLPALTTDFVSRDLVTQASRRRRSVGWRRGGDAGDLLPGFYGSEPVDAFIEALRDQDKQAALDNQIER
jgi:hypothetical protein